MPQQRQFTFYVNDYSYTRWYGATVKHAVIAHNQRILKDIREGRAWVTDARGDRVGMGGTLQEGVHLYIRYAASDK